MGFVIRSAWARRFNEHVESWENEKQRCYIHENRENVCLLQNSKGTSRISPKVCSPPKKVLYGYIDVDIHVSFVESVSHGHNRCQLVDGLITGGGGGVISSRSTVSSWKRFLQVS